MDVSRHVDVFNPGEWGDRRVDVIGVGAIGSKVAMELARLGVKNLHVWDHDVIERHNLANQAYLEGQVGQSKARAIGNLIAASGGALPTEHQQMWDGESDLGEVVFCMADSMEVRRQVSEALRTSFETKYVFEARMGADSAQLYAYRPISPDSRAFYEATLFGDEQVANDMSACGTHITVGPTASIAAGLLAWQFIRYANGQAPARELHVHARDFQLQDMERFEQQLEAALR